MATIKLQPSGAVVIKDGKVACSCCEGCCMYPALDLFDQFYSSSDLPDAVTVDGVSYARNGTSYGDTTNGVLLEGNVWVKYKNGVRSPRPCLIQGGVEDQFADSYMITPNVGDSASPTVVTRRSLCLWEGTDTCGNFVYLSYEANHIDGQGIAWNVFFRFYYTPTCVQDGRVNGQKNQDEFQNTPVGTYTGTFYDSAFVS